MLRVPTSAPNAGQVHLQLLGSSAARANSHAPSSRPGLEPWSQAPGAGRPQVDPFTEFHFFFLAFFAFPFLPFLGDSSGSAMSS